MRLGMRRCSMSEQDKPRFILVEELGGDAFEVIDDPRFEPVPMPDELPEGLDCNDYNQPHQWVRIGMTTNYGSAYECSRCGGQTP